MCEIIDKLNKGGVPLKKAYIRAWLSSCGLVDINRPFPSTDFLRGQLGASKIVKACGALGITRTTQINMLTTDIDSPYHLNSYEQEWGSCGFTSFIDSQDSDDRSLYDETLIPLHSKLLELAQKLLGPETNTNNTVTTGENNMTVTTNQSPAFRVVDVRIIDNTPHMLPENRVVHTVSNVNTDMDDQATILQACMGVDVMSALEEHNKKRAALVDEAILLQTGNEVNMRPIRFNQLEFKVIEK